VVGFAFLNELYDNWAGDKNLPSVKDEEKNVDSLFDLMQIKEETFTNSRMPPTTK
jgi:hypothetical protein